VFFKFFFSPLFVRPPPPPPPILKKSSAKGVLCFKVVEYYWTIIAGPQLNRRQ